MSDRPNVFYDDHGRQYYQGSDIHTADRKARDYSSYDRVYEKHRAPAPVSQTLPNEYRKSRVYPPATAAGAGFERDLQAKGYQVYKEELYDPHTGRLKDVKENPYVNTSERPDRGKTRAYADPVETLDRYGSSKQPKYVNEPVIANGYSYANRGFEFKEDDYYKSRGFPYLKEESISDIEKIKKPKQVDYSPPKWIFVFLTFVFLLFALLNLLLCFDYHNYCRFWLAGLCIFLAFFGFLHNGDYTDPVRTVAYVATAVLTDIACIVALIFLMDQVTDNWRCIALNNGNVLNGYALLRGSDTNLAKTYNNSVLRTCFVVDFLSIAAVFLGMYSLTAAVIVADRHWRRNNRHSLEIEPFCMPRLFNPYGQIQIGQASIVVGIITVYGCYHYVVDRNWQNIWTPVWAGGMTIFAASLSIFAFHKKMSKERACTAVFVQCLGALCLVAGIVVCIVGVVANVNTVADINDSRGVNEINATRGCDGVSVDNDFLKDEAVASAVLFAMALSVLLVSLFYALTQIIRHLSGMSRLVHHNNNNRHGDVGLRDRWLEQSVMQHGQHHGKTRSHDGSSNSRLGLKYKPDYTRDRAPPQPIYDNNFNRY